MNLVLAILMAYFSCEVQESKTIIGTWKGIKRELKNGESGEKYTNDGKPYTVNYSFRLDSDGTGEEFSLGTKFQYTIHNDSIAIGNRRYIIEKLTKSELILLEDKEGFFTFRIYFVKQTEES